MVAASSREDAENERDRREKILNRVRALLAMTVAKGCTEAEAMVAAGKASALMEEYDIAFSDAQSVRDEEVGERSMPYLEQANPHELHLGAMWVTVPIATFFDCKNWRNGSEVVFVGIKSDSELAHQMLALVSLAMDTELAAWLRTAAGAQAAQDRMLLSSFMRGMGNRIGERLQIIKAARTERSRSRGSELVVVKNQLIDEKFADYLRRTGQSDFTKGAGTSPPLSEVAFLAG